MPPDSSRRSSSTSVPRTRGTLNVHAHGGHTLAGELQQAIENYYGRLVGSANRELREHLLLGQLALFGGILIFFLSMGARQLLQGTLGQLPRILDEGLIILAWLALWRPTEVLAYEWVPLYRKRRLYNRLAAIRLAVRTEPIAAANSQVRAPSPGKA